MSTPITAQQVNDLRGQTGAGLMDCKRALEEVAHMHAAAHLWFPSSRLCSACRASFWAFMRLPACANTPICAYMRGAHICLHLMRTPGACVCLCIVCSPTETCKAPSTFCAKRAWQLLPKRSICFVGVSAAHNTWRPGQTCGVLSVASLVPCWVAKLITGLITGKQAFVHARRKQESLNPKT